MAIALGAVYVKHERRLVLVFSLDLAAGAFSSTSYYAVVCLDGTGADPSVRAAVPVVGNPASLELALSLDLVDGGSYQVSAVGVPGSDSSVTPGGSVLTFTVGESPTDADVEIQSVDLDALLFGTDLVWTGLDVLLQPNGDLASISGIGCYQSDMNRRLMADTALPWAPGWGLAGADSVNGPSTQAVVLRGSILRQVMADNRTKRASVTLTTSDSDPEKFMYVANIVPKGATDATPIPVAVPIP